MDYALTFFEHELCRCDTTPKTCPSCGVEHMLPPPGVTFKGKCDTCKMRPAIAGYDLCPCCIARQSK
jgi:hypothetical protein